MQLSEFRRMWKSAFSLTVSSCSKTGHTSISESLAKSLEMIELWMNKVS